MKNLCLTIGLAWVLCALCVPAHAYVLSAEEILKYSNRAQGYDKGLLARETVLVYPETGEAEPQTFTGTARYRFSDSFREDLQKDGQKEVFAVSPRGAARVRDGKLLSDEQGPYDLFKDLLLYRRYLRLKNRLELSGVNVNRVSLGRYNGKIAYVIGAQYPDETVPQVWIDKKTFLPLRWIVTRKKPGSPATGVEVRYEDWRPLETSKSKPPSRFYPFTITILENNRVVSQRKAVECVRNPEHGPRDFDVRRIKARAEPMEGAREKPAPPSMDEVKKALRDFRNLYDRKP